MSACSSPLTTLEIRVDLQQDNLEGLEAKMLEEHESRGELVTALNLARVYQLEGRWRDSINAFEQASLILEEYEQRAIVNARGVLGGLAKATVSAGGGGYYGSGYERTLLHTMNAMNYMLLEDFSGAAVEMRRMEIRQELWLEEKEKRLRELLEEREEEAEDEGYGLDSLPENYSMRSILADPELRSKASAYQDPFSYAVSSIICRIAGDSEYAAVSMRRASSLNPEAGEMFRGAWGGDRVPPLPSVGREQEVVLIMLGGLAPTLRREQIRIPVPMVGYVLVDMPAYDPPLSPDFTSVRLPGGSGRLYELLRTDLMAYSELRDNLDYEIATAVSRALSRVSVSFLGQALLFANGNLRKFVPLAGILISSGMDLLAEKMAESLRNWETLPAAGYLSMFKVRRGAALHIGLGEATWEFVLPERARGVVLVLSQAGSSNTRVDHVTY